MDISDYEFAASISRLVRSFVAQQQGNRAGFEFERHLHAELIRMQAWRHVIGPDQLDPGLPLGSRTGTTYEFDGVYVSESAFYFIEAKRLVKPGITREIVSVFVQKLLDLYLGSWEEIGQRLIYPILVGALPLVDAAAYRYALAWGVLLITPEYPTPCDIIASIRQQTTPSPRKQALERECTILAAHLWRPLQQIVQLAPGRRNQFLLNADAIYDATFTSGVFDQWMECLDAAQALGILTSPPS